MLCRRSGALDSQTENVISAKHARAIRVALAPGPKAHWTEWVCLALTLKDMEIGMRRQLLCGAAVIAATAAVAACAPYNYGYAPGYYAYDPYGPPPGYAPYGAYTPPPPPAETQTLPSGPAVSQNSVPPAGYLATCHKGLLWPFIRERGDCPTDVEKYGYNYPPLWYLQQNPS